MGTIKDFSIKIRPSRKLEVFISELGKEIVDLPDGIRKFIPGSEDGYESSLLNVSDLEWLQGYLSRGDQQYHLHELLEGSQVHLPQPEVLPRNPELEARVQRLRSQQAARDYRAMTRNVDAVRAFQPEDSIAYQIKQINRQLIAVAQFIFSVAAGFLFGFLGVELIVGNLDFGFRLLLGVMCALIIALAEIYFLAKKLSEDIFPSPPTKPHQE